MKTTLRIFLLIFAAVLGTWAMPAEARDRDHGRSYRGRSYYSDRSSYRGGRNYYSNRSYYRGGRSYYGGRGYGYYGPRYGYYRRSVVYDSPYYYDDYYYGRPYYGRSYYSRPAISIGVGGRHGFFRGIF